MEVMPPNTERNRVPASPGSNSGSVFEAGGSKCRHEVLAALTALSDELNEPVRQSECLGEQALASSPDGRASVDLEG